MTAKPQAKCQHSHCVWLRTLPPAERRRVEGDPERGCPGCGGTGLAPVTSKPDEYLGCTDGHCVIEKPRGMHTNGGCDCLDGMKPDRRIKLRKAIARHRAKTEAAQELWDLLTDDVGAPLAQAPAWSEVVQTLRVTLMRRPDTRKRIAELEAQVTEQQRRIDTALEGWS